jgi:hypothetical protein
MAAMSPASAPSPAIRRAAVQRGVGMAMLGSTIALLAMAALTWVGVVAIDEDIRGWTTAGIAVAAVIDGAIGLYFLRASSQP